MALVEKQKHKCDICGNITHEPYEASFVAKRDGFSYRSKPFEICEVCFDDGKTPFSSLVAWFRKICKRGAKGGS